MPRPRSAAFALLALATISSAQSPVTVREILDTSLEDYRRAVKKADSDLLATLQKAESAARRRGDKAAVDRLRTDRLGFEREGRAPLNVSLTAHAAAHARARVRVLSAYQKAVASHTKAGDDALAAKVEDEHKAFIRALCGITLWPGQTLSAEGRLCSTNGRFDLVLGSDGDLALCHAGDGKKYWRANPRGKGAYLRLLPDGDLVLFSKENRSIWSTRTGGNHGAKLVMMNDGILMLLAPSGETLWKSGGPE